MKILIYILAFIFIQTDTWIEYRASKPDFSVEFPSTPIEKEKIIKTDLGETIVKTVYAATKLDSTENSLYLLNYYKFDQLIFFGDSAITQKEYLEEALNNIKLNLSANLLYSNHKKDNSCPSIVYRLEMDKGNKVMKGKLIISGDYLFSLQVFSSKGYALNKNMDKFIDSFQHSKCD